LQRLRKEHRSRSLHRSPIVITLIESKPMKFAETRVYADVPIAPAPARQPAKPRARSDIKVLPVQTAAPFGDDPGAITVGHYSVQEDVVVMHDETGKPTGKRQQLAAWEDPRQVAYRLTRDSWQARAPDFNRRLNYPRAGIA
jgi:hypothetical protein